MARRTREEAQQTRIEIIDAAMRLFAQRGFAATSLDQVAAAIGMTRGAIYNHFRTKTELYEHLMRFSQDPLYDLLDEAVESDGSPIAAIRQYMVRWLDLLVDNRRHRDSFEILLNKTEMTDELQSLQRRERQLTRDMIGGLSLVAGRAVRVGELPSDTDAELCGLSIYAYLMGVTQSWLFNTKLFPLKELREPLVELFIQGLLSGQTVAAPSLAASTPAVRAAS